MYQFRQIVHAVIIARDMEQDIGVTFYDLCHEQGVHAFRRGGNLQRDFGGYELTGFIHLMILR